MGSAQIFLAVLGSVGAVTRVIPGNGFQKFNKVKLWKNRGIMHMHKIEYLNRVQGLETLTSRDFMRYVDLFYFRRYPFHKNRFW